MPLYLKVNEFFRDALLIPHLYACKKSERNITSKCLTLQLHPLISNHFLLLIFINFQSVSLRHKPFHYKWHKMKNGNRLMDAVKVSNEHFIATYFYTT